MSRAHDAQHGKRRLYRVTTGVGPACPAKMKAELDEIQKVRLGTQELENVLHF